MPNPGVVLERVGSTAERLRQLPYEKRVCKTEAYPAVSRPDKEYTGLSVAEFAEWAADVGLEATVLKGGIDRGTLANAESGVFLESAHGIPHVRIKTPSHRHDDAPEFNPIYDITSDPQQQDPIRDPKLEAELAGRMKEQLQRFGAPECQYARLGL